MMHELAKLGGALLASTVLLAAAPALAQDNSINGSDASGRAVQAQWSQQPEAAPQSWENTTGPGAYDSGNGQGTGTAPYGKANDGYSSQGYANGAYGNGTYGAPNYNSARPGSHENTAASEPLIDMRHAKARLMSASVVDRYGRQIGQVSNVHTTLSGRPTSVRVALNMPDGGVRHITMNADELTYNPTDDVVLSNRTAYQITGERPMFHGANYGSAYGNPNYAPGYTNQGYDNGAYNNQNSNPNDPNSTVSPELGPQGF